MNVRRTLWALLAAAALSLALSSSAHAAKAVHVSCGETITADTKLANDLTDCPNEGIIIGADDITLDLNGHTVDGDGTLFEGCPDDEPCDVGIVNAAHDGPRPVNGPGHEGVRIENGTIRDFAVGFYGVGVRANHLRHLTIVNSDFHGVLFVRGSTYNQIENSTFRDDGFSGIVLDRSDHNRVVRNSVTNSGDAIFLVTGSDHNVIEKNSTSEGDGGILVLEDSAHNLVARNSVFSNVFPGIVIEANDNTVIGNRVFDNGDGLIVFGSRNTIVNNYIADAIGCPDGCGLGISVEGGEDNLIARNEVRRTQSHGILVAAFDPDLPTVDTVVRDNRVHDATADGFSVATEGDGTVSGTLIEGNTAIGSGDDGFDIRSASTTLTSNLAVRNSDLGIEAVPGVTDGGGNKAHANANPLQCTNVACK